LLIKDLPISEKAPFAGAFSFPEPDNDFLRLELSFIGMQVVVADSGSRLVAAVKAINSLLNLIAGSRYTEIDAVQVNRQGIFRQAVLYYRKPFLPFNPTISFFPTCRNLFSVPVSL